MYIRHLPLQVCIETCTNIYGIITVIFKLTLSHIALSEYTVRSFIINCSENPIKSVEAFLDISSTMHTDDICAARSIIHNDCIGN